MAAGPARPGLTCTSRAPAPRPRPRPACPDRRKARKTDACHRIDDRERLEAIRSMHELHRKAGRAALSKAVQALTQLQPEHMPPSVIARLLELGAKLERSTLIVSVEELQGVDLVDEEPDDPWERIARELDPRTSAEL